VLDKITDSSSYFRKLERALLRLRWMDTNITSDTNPLTQIKRKHKDISHYKWKTKCNTNMCKYQMHTLINFISSHSKVPCMHPKIRKIDDKILIIQYLWIFRTNVAEISLLPNPTRNLSKRFA